LILYTNNLYRDILVIYPKSLKEDLISLFNEKQVFIKSELKENIATNGSFSLTLDA
jgi:hypothetical protein